jgi:phage gpG-like protein
MEHEVTEEDLTLHEERRRQGIVPPLLARMASYASGASLLGMHTDHSEPSPAAIRRKQRLEARPLLRRLGDILHTAHAQDFERKKRPDSEEVKHDKDEEEEEVLDTHGSKVDDAKVEVAKRVAEALAEQAAKAAEEAEVEEEALQELAKDGGGKTGESSKEMERRVKGRFQDLEED